MINIKTEEQPHSCLLLTLLVTGKNCLHIVASSSWQAGTDFSLYT